MYKILNKSRNTDQSFHSVESNRLKEFLLFKPNLDDENFTESLDVRTRSPKRADSVYLSLFSFVKNLPSSFMPTLLCNSSIKLHNVPFTKCPVIINDPNNLSLHSFNLFNMQTNSNDSPKLRWLSLSLNSLSRNIISFTHSK